MSGDLRGVEHTAGGTRAGEATILKERGSYDTRARGVVSRWLQCLDSPTISLPLPATPLLSIRFVVFPNIID